MDRSFCRRGAAVLALPVALAAAGCRGGSGAQGDPSQAAPTAAAPAAPGSPAATPAPQLARVEFRVEGMTCAGCVVGTRAALRRLQGVHQADASYDSSSAWAVYDSARVTPEQMIAAIRELGYTATLVRS